MLLLCGTFLWFKQFSININYLVLYIIYIEQNTNNYKNAFYVYHYIIFNYNNIQRYCGIHILYAHNY